MKKTQKNNAAEQTMGGKQASIQEAKGGVQFELVGVPACMDENAQSIDQPQNNQIGEVMVFDFGKPSSTKSKPSKKPSRTTWKDRQQIQQDRQAYESSKYNEEAEEVQILVSDKDREKLEARHIDQTQAELEHYRHMIDKMLGTDEELREETKHRGGEVVQLDANVDPSEGNGDTRGAQAAGNIDQTANDEGSGSSSYEEDYADDFHEMLEEVVMDLADLEEDRDDDPELELSTPNLSTD